MRTMPQLLQLRQAFEAGFLHGVQGASVQHLRAVVVVGVAGKQARVWESRPRDYAY